MLKFLCSISLCKVLYASELTDQMIDKARKAGKALVIECDPEQEATKHIAVKHGFVWSERSDGLDIYRLS